jgi:hypothetical protein
MILAIHQNVGGPQVEVRNSLEGLAHESLDLIQTLAPETQGKVLVDAERIYQRIHRSKVMAVPSLSQSLEQSPGLGRARSRSRLV